MLQSETRKLTRKQKLFLEYAENCRLDEIEKLIGAVDINTVNEDGYSALMLAIKPSISMIVNPDFVPAYKKATKSEMVSWLVDNGAELEYARASGYQAIHYATKHGEKEVVEILINKNPDLVNSTVETWQPLHFAAYHNRYDIAKTLIINGADVNKKILWDSTEKSVEDIIEQNVLLPEEKEDLLALIRSKQLTTNILTATNVVSMNNRHNEIYKIPSLDR